MRCREHLLFVLFVSGSNIMWNFKSFQYYFNAVIPFNSIWSQIVLVVTVMFLYSKMHFFDKTFSFSLLSLFNCLFSGLVMDQFLFILLLYILLCTVDNFIAEQMYTLNLGTCNALRFDLNLKWWADSKVFELAMCARC